MIGHMAEVTVPIVEGRTGEIMYIVQSKRFNSPARAAAASMEIKKGAKVMICDVSSQYTTVEPWTESFTDPAFDGEIVRLPQKNEVEKQES